MTNNKRRIEQILHGVAIFVGGCTLTVLALGGRSNHLLVDDNREAKDLQARYGPATNSEGVEEWILKDFFGGKRNGVFVDVGASDYRRFSNTYYLETERGWSGVAIDALESFEADYRLHRPNTRFRSFYVSDRSNERAKLFLLDGNSLVTSSDRSFTERYGDTKKISEVETATITLDDLLSREGIRAIDFMSMDIELAEPKALAGFDIERFRPVLVCVEAHADVRQQILSYFASHRYVVLGKYLKADTRNLWFSPLP